MAGTLATSRANQTGKKVYGSSVSVFLKQSPCEVPSDQGYGLVGMKPLLCVYFLLSVVPTAAQERPTEVLGDSLLLETAYTLTIRAPAIARVWPGFWPEHSSFILAREGSAVLLVAYDEPGSDFVGLPPLERYPLLDSIAFRKVSPTGLNAVDEGTYDREYRTGDVLTTAVALKDTPRKTVETLLHEAFHDYQSWARGGRTLADSVFLEHEYNVLAELERAILGRAILETHTPRLRALLTDYLRVRRFRDARFAAVADWERGIELSEGTAHYVGRVGGSLIAEGDVDLLGEVRERLSRPLVIEESIRFVGRADRQELADAGARMKWAHRFRIYPTGAALGLILDRLESGWKEMIERGMTFPSILAEILELPHDMPPEEIDEVWERYGSEAMEQRVEELLRRAHSS